MSADIGVIGLAVMGQNLALNIASKGFRTAVYNRTLSKVDATEQRAKDEGVKTLLPFKDLQSFVAALRKPRVALLMVEAGSPVDKVLQNLLPLLEPGDVVIDGGNEWFETTERRIAEVSARGLHYMGMGVSGGEEGARKGPALMPGGSKEAYDIVAPILKKVAAQVSDGPCVSYIGGGGAGHYVKMVHNGIEYGDMQVIAEAYNLLKTIGGLSNDEMHQIFEEWNESELQSFLIEITAAIFEQPDDRDPEKRLVDQILDVAGAKGTGSWTVQESARRGVPAPTIQAALAMRQLSALKEQREEACALYHRDAETSTDIDRNQLKNDIKDAMYCSKICSYAQGMSLLSAASRDFGWNLNYMEIARGWKGGCIIRAAFLDRIRKAYSDRPTLSSLLFDPGFAQELKSREIAWRRLVAIALAHKVPAPALAGSLTYFDSLVTPRLPMNLVQAQRDCFGAHTYKRVDAPTDQIFHTQWNASVV